MVIQTLYHLHEAIAACRMCSDAGYFAQSSDVVIGMPAVQPGLPGLPRMMLVGQAPASSLRSKGLPFSGQAGRVLYALDIQLAPFQTLLALTDQGGDQ